MTEAKWGNDLAELSASRMAGCWELLRDQQSDCKWEEQSGFPVVGCLDFWMVDYLALAMVGLTDVVWVWRSVD